jgi:1-acyl-sn-glycerol-3-phosphate acyltransferase
MKNNFHNAVMKMYLLMLIRITTNIFLVLLFFFLILVMAVVWALMLCISSLIPVGSLRLEIKKKCLFFGRLWSFVSRLIVLFNTDVVITGDYDCLVKKNHYIVISNHQGFADIMLNCLLQPSVSFFSYVMKKSLLWQLPVISWYCYYYGFPFLNRKNRQKDIRTLKKSFRNLILLGNSLVIYPESTRFTQEKKHQSESPYKYLLRPRLGGLATSLYALKDYVDGLVNVTIVYSGKGLSLVSLLSRKISKIHIHVELIELDDSFFGDFSSPDFKKDFSDKMNYLWQEKDDLIERLKKN